MLKILLAMRVHVSIVTVHRSGKGSHERYMRMLQHMGVHVIPSFQMMRAFTRRDLNPLAMAKEEVAQYVEGGVTAVREAVQVHRQQSTMPTTAAAAATAILTPGAAAQVLLPPPHHHQNGSTSTSSSKAKKASPVVDDMLMRALMMQLGVESL